MKSYDLAKLLLSGSNKEVYITQSHFDEYYPTRYYAEEVFGIDESPFAIFLSTGVPTTEATITTPEEKPSLYGYKILLQNDVGIRAWYLPEDSHYYDFLSNIEYKYFYSYSYYEDGDSLGVDLGGLEKDYPNCEKTFYEDHILYVEVVTEIVDNGWTPVYSRFSLQEATDYFTKLQRSLSTSDNEEQTKQEIEIEH